MRATNGRRKTVAAGALVAGLAMVGAMLPVGTSNAAPVSQATQVSTHEQMPGMAMHDDGPRNAAQSTLYLDMRTLWAEHMEWTYAAIAAFAAESPGLPATLDRLLRNQSDIGQAIKPFYGKKAANQLTALLEEHINDAVPVLVAAKAGDQEALNTAVADWYDNADRIGVFLAKANPNWGRTAMKKMMRTHITQTITYASKQLTGDHAGSIRAYDRAEAHMVQMADMLSSGLVKQFPRKFR